MCVCIGFARDSGISTRRRNEAASGELWRWIDLKESCHTDDKTRGWSIVALRTTWSVFVRLALLFFSLRRINKVAVVWIHYRRWKCGLALTAEVSMAHFVFLFVLSPVPNDVFCIAHAAVYIFPAMSHIGQKKCKRDLYYLSCFFYRQLKLRDIYLLCKRHCFFLSLLERVRTSTLICAQNCQQTKELSAVYLTLFCDYFISVNNLTTGKLVLHFKSCWCIYAFIRMPSLACRSLLGQCKGVSVSVCVREA